MDQTPGSSFPTTNWSELGRLASPDFATAMERLCQRYWYPVFVFIRRRCGDLHRAEDLTQAFFAKVLAKQTFRAADPAKGRFRSFLLTAVQNFVADEYASGQTVRRGGQETFVTIDFVTAEQLYLRNQSSDGQPDDEFDRAWALTLMEHAIERLRNEYNDKDQTLRFELLSPILRSVALDHDAIAAALNMTATAARKAASRFRQRYGQILRDEISATLSQSGELSEEIAWIMRLFAK